MAQETIVAARVWGKFQCPPLLKHSTYKDVFGVVQLGYQKQSNGIYKAYVVWIPHKVAREALNDSSTLDDVFFDISKPDYEIIKSSDLSNPDYEMQMLAIDAELVEKFEFHGGAFFELFRNQGKPRVRLPIAVNGRNQRTPVVWQKGDGLHLDLEVPCLSSGSADQDWDRAIWSEVYPFRSHTAPVPVSTIGRSVRIREHYKEIMSLLQEPIPIDAENPNVRKNLRLDLSASTVRFRYESLPVRWLRGHRKVLRSTGSNASENLQIAFGSQESRSLRTEASQFGLSITANWKIDKEHLAACLGETQANNDGISAEVFPEVYWTNFKRQPDSDKYYEGLEVLWDAFKQSLFVRDFLKSTGGGLTASFLPSLVGDLPAQCELALGYERISFTYKAGLHISQCLPETKPLPQCISFLSDIASISSSSSNEKDVAVSFENHLGEQSTVTLAFSHYQPSPTFFKDSNSQPMLCFKIKSRIQGSTLNSDVAYDGAVGGLTLSFSSNYLADRKEGSSGQVIIGIPLDDDGFDQSADGRVPRLSVYWEFYINVLSVRSNRVDVPWGDREVRQLPLVVPLKQDKSNSPFVLRVRESISPRQDRHLVCDIFENNETSSSASDSYLLLSRDPWSIMRFSRRQFSSSGDANDASIATFDSDSRVWRYKMLAPEYRFQFPPQVIGESADKPRSLELHDINAIDPNGKLLRETDVKAEFIRPAPGDQGTRRSYVVENALTPSLDLWVKPTDLERKYVIAEWNAYELFRQRNDFGIGGALRAMRGEFLYGLMFSIETALEKSRNSLARVSEIEAIMGILPQRSYKTLDSDREGKTDNVLKKLSERWLAIRQALLSRQERLEVWTPAYDQARPFAPARFESGARFALRSTALFRSPTGDEGLKLTADESLRVKTDQGLSGGALWPIEFQSFWKALQERPQFDGGSIENVAIGPTGGDAIQSAKFLNGLVTIASETRAGFVHRQRVEILGRVGAFWNRAKHVIIYERTVNPSEQFAPEPVEGDQDAWRFSRSRRAVLRKVTEYIEILEPTRCYPDEPTGTPKQSAFLNSVRFETKIIFVDSAWGRDVNQGGAEGYEIPLWNLRAAKMRPNVYRMPGFVFVTVGEGREELPLVPRQCANPDNLYFYALSSTREGDTNKWPPLFTVDYANLVDPSYCEQHAVMGGLNYGSSEIDGVPQGRKPSPPRVLPGHGRFTWRLLPSSEKTLLNAEYGSKPVYGELETITFSRGEAVKLIKGPLKEHIETDARAIGQISETHSYFQKHLTDIQSLRLHELSDGSQLPPALAADISRIQDNIKKNNSKLEAAITNINALVTKYGDEDKRKDFLKQLGVETDFKKTCERLKNEIATIAHRKRLLVVETISSFQVDLKNYVEKQFAEAGPKEEFKKKLVLARRTLGDIKLAFPVAVSELFAGFGPLNAVLRDSQNGIEKLRGNIELAQRMVSSAVDDIDALLLSAHARISEMYRSAETQLDWGVERYSRYRTQFNDEIASIQAELTRAHAELCSRAGAELDSLLPGFGGSVIESAKVLLEGVSKSLVEISSVLPIVPKTNIPDTVRDKTESLLSTISTVRSQLKSNEQMALGKIGNFANDSLNAASNQLNSYTNAVLRTQFLGRSLAGLIDQTLLNSIDKEISQTRSLSDTLITSIEKSIILNLPDIGGYVVNRLPAELLLDGVVNNISDACSEISGLVRARIDAFVPFKELEGFSKALDQARTLCDEFVMARDSVKGLKEGVEKILGGREAFTSAASDLAGAGQAYSNRVLEGFAKVGSGGIWAAPSNVLKIVSASTASPELGQMQANADRMRCAYEEAKLATTKMRATFGKLGDALKALGIDVPFEGLADELSLPDDIVKKYDISQLFPNFGGLDLKGLLPNVKVPDGVKDTVKLSHDFDKKQFRAWVQIDVNMPLKGKKELFAIGPFAVSFRDTLLTALLRAEASKDTEQVSTTAKSEIATIIDVEIGGERMLSLEDVAIRYNKESGIDFQFDPKKIKLQQSLQFVQDTLGQIFGDEIGGMKLIKQNGVPIGVSHEYSLPNISFMGVTSGISNIQISNSFKLLAYPDFVISNRFNLSRAELPFLFSFFIVGGSGYVYIDASYRPFDQTLMVEVEASAGGSAALGLSLGPVQGSVFVSFSLVITYRKTLTGGTATGDGLAVSTQLVIAGNVSLYGMVDVYIGILLRMQYGEGGKIDGKGRIDLRVKLCRFITLKYSSEMTLKLRNGRTETTRMTSTSAEPGERIKQQADRLKQYEQRAKQLEGARL